MTSKTKNLVRWIPSIAIALFLTTSAILKLVHAPQLAELYTRVGFENNMVAFGIAELLFIGLFLVPATMKIGLLLFTGYYGGAMAVELSIKLVPIAPAFILTLIWAASYLRDASLFGGKSEQRKIESASPHFKNQ